MLPINPNLIPQIYSKAQGLQAKGNAKEALDLYASIIAANPKVAEAHFQVGQIHLKALRFADAAAAFGKAAVLKPREGAIWTGYTEALLRLDDQKAISAALRVLHGSGLPAATRNQIAARLSNQKSKTSVDTGGVDPRKLQEVVGLLNKGDPAGAEQKVRALLRSSPSVAVLHNMLGATRNLQSDRDGAEAAFRKAVALAPDYAEAFNSLGQVLLEKHALDEAVSVLERARSLTPKSTQVLTNLGAAYTESGRRALAHEVLNLAIKADSKNARAFQKRARAHIKDGNQDAALKDLGQVLALGMKTAQIYQMRAQALSSLNRGDEALEAIEEAIRRAPTNGEMLGTRASILQGIGDFDAADKAFAEAFDKAPTTGANYRTFSASHKYTNDDPMIARMEEIHARDDLSSDDRMQLGFALSKAMEDIKDYPRVFRFLNEANALMRAKHGYTVQLRRSELDRMKAAFADFDPADHPLTGDSDYAPIFVTGMPRSGTTLVEQIISSHSKVTGAGEVGRFARDAYALALPMEGDRAVGDIPASEIKTLARDYEAYMRNMLPEAEQITDKSIQTYFVMGLVWLSLPKAKIVVVRRDPRDNLLSIYKNVFPDGTHLYSYDLDDLGQYYRMFVEMIEFWREIAPDRFYEIRYDDLIDSPEEESRKLIAACGLDWEDACLNFHQNKRRVDTLSVYQVRQPIYKSSLKAWQRYEDDLQPLFKSLGDLDEG